MREFQILFDRAEPSEIDDPAYSSYGHLGFPAPPADRPWIFANFVQSVDGIASLLGPDPSGADIAQSPEDRWLMDLLRAHADAVIAGIGTLKAEQRLGRPRPRGPVFRIVDPALQQLRARLGRGRERNIFVTAASDFQLKDFAAFDGDVVDAYLLTTASAAERLAPQLAGYPSLKVVVAGQGSHVDLAEGMRILRRQHGLRYLLCEGGPTFYANMLRASLIDEKFLTVSPFDAGSELPASQRRPGEPTHRPTVFSGEGFAKADMVRWQWLSSRRVDDHQFHRFRRK